VTISGPGYPSTDATFAGSLKRARDTARLTQEEVADQMASRGFPFHQATVYKIEAGSRKVSIAEASALADIVKLPLGFMIEDAIDGQSEMVQEAREIVEGRVELSERVAWVQACEADLKLFVDRWEAQHGNTPIAGDRTPRELFAPLLEWPEIETVWRSWELMLKDPEFLAVAQLVGIDVVARWESAL
jgi:transcriptional regulator with XRE-family HTH domain